MQSQGSSPLLNATLADSLLLDRDGDGRLDAGDVLRYTLDIVNCGPGTAENVQFTGQRDLNTQFMPSSVQVDQPIPAPECAPPAVVAPPADNPTSVPPPVDTVTPAVLSTTPADGASAVAVSANITLEFNKNVNVAGDWFGLVCTLSGTFNISSSNVTVSGGPLSFVLDPNVDLQSGEICTLTVVAALVTDQDTDDPPDTLAADYVFGFTTYIDAVPTVQAVTPANGAVAVPVNTTIGITFSESVEITSAVDFGLECGGAPIAYTVTTPGSLPASTTTVVLTPAGNLPSGSPCTVTVLGSVSDTDTDDPPDTLGADYVFSFTTYIDAAPTVQAVTPANGAVAVPTNTTINITFSEPVNIASAGDFSVECGGMPQGYTVTTPATLPASTTTVVITPAGNLPEGQTCTVTVFSSVNDTDSDDPPDQMVLDYSFTFDTLVEFGPTVDQPAILPASTSTGANSASLDAAVSTTPIITVPFSEAVDLSTGAFSLTCNAVPIAVTTSPSLPALNQTSIDISSLTPLAGGTNCVLTVVSTAISDVDPYDPPNGMATNFGLSFSTDAAPTEIGTETEVGGVFQDVTGAGASNVDLDSDLVLTFSEAVTVTFPTNGLQCPVGNNIPVTVTTNGAASIVLNPNVNLPLNTACGLSIPAANISDVDPVDAPDTPVAAVTHAFQTVDDDAPTVTTNPTAGGSNVAVNSNITVVFNEAVTLTSGWFSLDCSVSGKRVSTGELTGTGITIIENTPDLVYTIDPTVDLAAGDICTITIASAEVVDNDGIDAPNELDGDASADVVDGDSDDYVAVFSSADIPPTISSSSPADTDTVGTGQVVTLNFSEAVNVAAGAFSFECPSGVPLTSSFTTSTALPATSITTIDLIPTDPLPLGAACVVVADASLVVDSDLVDPPNFLDGNSSGDLIDDADDFTLNFQVGAVPLVLSTNSHLAFSDALTLPSTTERSLLALVFDFGTEMAQAQAGSDFSLPLGPIVIGSIPAQSRVRVTFDVSVNVVIPDGTTTVGLQGIVSGSNFPSFLTDDPATSVSQDSTLTTLDSLRAVTQLPQTGETGVWQMVAVWTIRLLLVGGVLAVWRLIRRRFALR
ncbi:MAG: Ig-like domain-containing protein [Chloroflexi bacterium]|uniref:Ig-like domain-containing protein n=1 Tax=Candidatus Flexifilum breve TaxID=3140694 RepID=UPI003136C31E|nr:Ig-like domain-containing protein [Chloroflexota bacterium]